MKIFFLCRLYYPHIGGVEKHVAQISKKLISNGHKIFVITEKYDNKLKDFEMVQGVTVYRINTGTEGRFKKFRIWREIFNLRNIINTADIIHCHDVFFWYLPFRFIFPNKPVYTTFHGYESYPISKKAILIRNISAMLSMGNICIGDFIPKWYGTKTKYVSYGAVDIPKSTGKITRSKKDSAVFIGRLDEQTNILTYWDSITLIKKKYPHFDLTIIGDGKFRKILERNTSVLGFQKNPEKYFLRYHFAFVSRYLSILEAFAAKKLVFALYDNPVKEDYLRMAPFNKWIIIENTPKKLAERVIYYLTNPEAEKKLIEKSYQWVTEQTWENLTNVYLKLWGR